MESNGVQVRRGSSRVKKCSEVEHGERDKGNHEVSAALSDDHVVDQLTGVLMV